MKFKFKGWQWKGNPSMDGVLFHYIFEVEEEQRTIIFDVVSTRENDMMDSAAMVLSSKEALNNRIELSKKIFTSLSTLIRKNGNKVLSRAVHELYEGSNLFESETITEYEEWEIELK